MADENMCYKNFETMEIFFPNNDNPKVFVSSVCLLLRHVWNAESI